MSLLLRFPFRFGPATVTSVTTAATPLWVRLSATPQTWVADQAQLLPRFEHIYPEADTGPGWTKVTDVVQ